MSVVGLPKAAVQVWQVGMNREGGGEIVSIAL